MSLGLQHLLIAPIVLPLLTGAALLMVGDRHRGLRSRLNLVSTLLLWGVTVALLVFADQGGEAWTRGGHLGPTGASTAAVAVYLPGNWPVPIGIALAMDRLSALMLVLTSTLGLATAVYASARWDRGGAHFHSMFQFQLMGLCGAFLTADLFNLFVFFEVLLAASYGLVLHGTGEARVRAGLHYVVVNLAGASLFLIGVSLVYAVTGTLNIADISQRIPSVAEADRGLLQTGIALLGVVFLVKAAAWPVNFWLQPTYSSAAAPVAALFAIMTKVGIYAILRLGSLWIGPETEGAAVNFREHWLTTVGLVTVIFAILGVLGSRGLGRLASFLIILSSGTLMAAIGLNQAQVTSGALFYLANSTLAGAAFFMLIEMIERSRAPGENHPADWFLPHEIDQGDDPLDADVEIIGRPIEAATAFLGLAFILCGLLLAGLPPISGFFAKLSLLTGVISPGSLRAGMDSILPGNAAWWLFGLTLASGLAGAIAFTRAGVGLFWATSSRPAPVLRLPEVAPVIWLLLISLALTVFGGEVTRYLQEASVTLDQPEVYREAVMRSQPMNVFKAEGGYHP